MENKSYQVVLKGLPDDFGRLKTKEIVVDKLRDEDAVVSIEFIKMSDGSVKRGCLLVQLRNDQHLKTLLAARFIEVEFNDALHNVVVTKPRSQSVAAEYQAEKPMSSVMNETITKKKLSATDDKEPLLVSDSRSQSSQDDVDISSKQRSLYCTRIPAHMYDRMVLKEHFRKFGHVTRVFVSYNKLKKFAVIEYEDHDSAVFAKENASDLSPLNVTIRIEWNLREVGRLKAEAAGFPAHMLRKSKSTGNVRGRELQISKLNPISWNRLLEQDRDLFCKPYNRCILVQSNPHNFNNAKLRAYFVTMLGSTGGNIIRMIPVVDGVLVEFNDEQIVERVMAHGDHVIDAVRLKIYRKLIPKVYEDRFIIEGEIKNEATLTALLECCAEDDANFTTEKLRDDSFLVTYDTHVDVNEIRKTVENMSLENVQLKIRELCHTDCIVVNGLTDDVTSDLIKLTFMNKKLLPDGDVTMVNYDHTSQTAIVCFASYKNAESVVEKSKQTSISISIQQVDLSLCYEPCDKLRPARNQNNIRKGSNKPRFTPKGKASKEQGLRSFDYLLENDRDVIEYVRRSPRLVEELSQAFDDISQVEFMNRRDRVIARFLPLPKQKLRSSLENDQGKFEAECTRIIIGFMGKFSSQSTQCNPEKLSKIRKSHLWNEEVDAIKVEVKEDEVVSVFVRWNDSPQGGVKVTGLHNDVTSVISWLRKRCDSESVTKQFDKDDFQILEQLHIINDISERFHGSVEVKVYKRSRTVTLKGLTYDVTEANAELKKRLQNMSTSKLEFLDENQREFLRHSLSESNPNNQLLQHIKAQFRSNKVQALFRTGPCLHVVYNQPSDLQIVAKTLCALIETRDIQVEKDFDHIIQSREWKQLEQGLDEGSLKLVKDRRKSSLTLVGIATSVKTAYQRITEHITENIVEERVIALPYPIATFLETFPKQSNAEANFGKLEWQMTSSKGGGIWMKGKCLEVARAENWLFAQLQVISVCPKTITEPGMKKYFRGKDGKEFLQTTQILSECVILDGVGSQSGWTTSTQIQKPQVAATASTAKTLCSVPIPGGNATLHVMRHDITQVQCDAIVNTSNEELELRNAGVSGSIMRKGGALIQKEMDKVKWKLGGQLTPGQAVVTNSGNLPCKKLIHVAGPVWSHQNVQWACQCVKDCVTSCLQECDRQNLTSIAIPAISCGVFGGDPRTCAKLVVQAIFDYFNMNNSSIAKVYLVELAKQEILDHFTKEVQKISSSSGTSLVQKASNFFSKLTGSGTKIVPPQPVPKIVPVSSPQIQIIYGDIATAVADVLVTSSTPGKFPRCNSATSKALMSRAGVGLQRDCQMLASSAPINPGDVYNTNGYNLNCKEVYHVVLNEYRQGFAGSHELRSGIQKCLQMADNSGYSRIAIPAIGTGGLRYPADLVSSVFNQEINGFKGQNLRNVDLVLDQNNPNVGAVFQQTIPSSSTSGGMRAFNHKQLYGVQSVSAQTIPSSSTSGGMGAFKGRQPYVHIGQSVSAQTIPSPRTRGSMGAFNRMQLYGVQSVSAQTIPSSIIPPVVRRYPRKTRARLGSVSITVQQGDILQSNCDAIINPTSNTFDQGGLLSQQLIARGGQSIIQECQTQPLHSSSYYRVTNAGSLKCKYVIHLVSPGNASQIPALLASVLQLADATMNLNSIAIPAIATGNAGLKSSDVAQAIQVSFQNFQKTNPQYLRTIDVVIFDQSLLQDFQSVGNPAIATVAPQQVQFSSTPSPQAIVNPPPPKPTPRKSIIPSTVKTTTGNDVTVTLCSNKQGNIDQAWQRIQQQVKDKSVEKTIENEAVGSLCLEEEKEIIALMQKHDVLVKRITGSGSSPKLVITGLKDDVMDAYTSASEIIQDYKEAITCAEYVTWKYKDPQTNQFEDFLLKTSFQIESAYKKNSQGSTTVKFLLNGQSRKFLIDFASMTETSLDRNYSTSISRALKSSSDDLPSHWEDMRGKQWMKVQIPARTPEYQQIMSQFTSSGGAINVVTLERIQNPTLYKQFMAQKRKVEARMQSSHVTRMLFHGTSGDVCASIYKDGFDRSHCGKNGTAHGKGVYFATTSSYSMGYAQTHSSGYRHMFLAEVITGEYCQGSPAYVTPPLKRGSSSDHYDSVVNSTGSPSVYVVFKDASVYPAYILTFA